jgi:hypothetical protein
MERSDFRRLAELATQICATEDEQLLASARMRSEGILNDLVWSFEVVVNELGEAPHPVDPPQAFVLEQLGRMLNAYRRALLERRIRQGELFAADAVAVLSPRERRANRRFAGGKN